MATKLYVGNLSYSTQEEDLRALFAQYGEIVSLNIVMDRDTGRSKGFGFVEMSDDAAAQAAASALDGGEFEGRNLKVNEARPKPAYDSRPRRY
ncbi:MAG: RNA-binding protein [Spirochaetaceae bacterium]|nr:MAG: RNA-binding protein [Spirochaetaceae bacterium]